MADSRPTFTFSTYVLRGRWEHETRVTATYAFDGEGAPELLTADTADNTYLSREEWAQIEDDMADRCDADWMDADFDDSLAEAA